MWGFILIIAHTSNNISTYMSSVNMVPNIVQTIITNNRTNNIGAKLIALISSKVITYLVDNVGNMHTVSLV